MASCCQVCIEYQNLAGVAQRQVKSRRVKVELKHGGVGDSAHLTFDLLTREVSSHLQIRCRCKGHLPWQVNY